MAPHLAYRTSRFALFGLMALTLAFVFSSVASAVPFAGKRVTSVSFKGLKRIEQEALLQKMQTKVGTTVRNQGIRSDIQAIFDLGYFSDITINGNPSVGGVALTVAVVERPVISRVRFEGNEQASTEDLEEATETKEWAILDVNRLRSDVEKIQAFYEEKGYYLAKVSYELKKVNKDEVEVIYRIRDYDKVQIKKVTFLNNKVYSDEQLKRLLAQTQEGGLLSFITDSGNFKEEAFKQDLQRLTLWYLDNGYLKFRHDTPVVTISDDKKWLYISIYVEENDQYRIGDVTFSGDLIFPTDELESALSMNPGDVFRITERNKDIQALSEKYQDRGFAFTNVIPNLKFDDVNRTVDVNWNFQKGNLVYIGEVNILGNLKTHDKVIRRELQLHEGDLFSGSKLRVSRERVERLGFFEPGEVIFNTLTRKGRDDVVDIEITIKERTTGTITLGAGYGNQGGFFLTTQIQEINLFGRGQSLNLNAQLSTQAEGQRSLNLGFTDPYAFDTRWSLGFDLFFVNFAIPNRYFTQRKGIHFRGGYQFDNDIFLYLTYKLEGLNITDRVIIEPDNTDQGVLSSVVTNFVRDKRNNRFETTGGNYQSVQLELAGLGGDKYFWKTTLNNRWYFPIIGDLVFRHNFEIGYVGSLDGRAVPPSDRFYLGGPANMRGYPFSRVGPTAVAPRADGNGDLVYALGGVAQAFAIVELEYPIIKSAGLKFVTFFEAGNAWAEFPGVNGAPGNLLYDVGMGIRWFSPLGPLRFEWGWPLVTPAIPQPIPNFVFFIGQPF